ncbi:unnamed protein product, partial [Discosporangium mesarthrocarpum]
RQKAIRLARLLGANKVVAMPNGNIDMSGPLAKAVTDVGTEDEFRGLAKLAEIEAISPVAGEAVAVWP